MTRRSFTMIELAAVCIVALIAIILLCCALTSYNRKHAAYNQTCLDNLQKLKSALQMYADDNRAFLPDRQNEQGLAQLMQHRYITEGSCLICPETKDTPATTWQTLTKENCSYIYKGGLYLNELKPEESILSDKSQCHKNKANTLSGTNLLEY